MAQIYWNSTSSTDWATAGNWSPAQVPTDGDDVIFSNNSISVTTNLAQSTTQLASLTIDQSYTGQIGTSTAYLVVDATTLNIGTSLYNGNNTGGSGRIKLSGAFTTVNVFNSANQGVETALPPVLLAGTITTYNQTNGVVGIAMALPFETATATTIVVKAGTLALGNVTHTTVNQQGGVINDFGASTLTTLNLNGGVYNALGTSAITTANIREGSLVYKSTGTITNLNVYAGSVADFTQDIRAKTITTANVYGGSFKLSGYETVTNPVNLYGIDLNDITLLVGLNKKLTIASI